MNAKGFAHPVLLLAVPVVFGLVGFAGYTVYQANSPTKNLAHTQTVPEAEILPSPLSDMLSLEAIEEIVGINDNLYITQFELDQEDGIAVFKVTLSNGFSKKINAISGKVISEEPSDEHAENTLPPRINLGITFEKAREIAQGQFTNSRIEKIKLELESGTLIISVRFHDKARVDIDAANGTVLRTKSPQTETNQSSTSDSTSSGRTVPRQEDEHNSGPNHDSLDDDDETEDDETETEVKIEGTLVQNGTKYSVTQNGTTYSLQTSSNLSGLVGKNVRAEGDLSTNNTIIVEKIEQR